jgi:hypothetical protein
MSEDFEDFLRIYVPKDMSLEKGWELEALVNTVETAMWSAARAGKEIEDFQMTIEVPAALGGEQLDRLFEMLATAAHDFADSFPERTWDVFVAGGMLSEEHSAEAAFWRVCEENERLRERIGELEAERDA